MNANVDCPHCRNGIPLEDVSVSTDIALCRVCGEHWKYAELLSRREAGITAASPPGGAWYAPGIHGFEAGASTRSPIALFLVPFMCVWSGFSMWGTYGLQIYRGKFDLAATLFGIPFLLGTVVLGVVTLKPLAGKVVVTVRGDEATVFTGLGAVGRTRRFKWSEVTALYTVWNYARHGQGNQQIVIEADRQIKLYTLNPARQRFLLAALQLHQKS